MCWKAAKPVHLFTPAAAWRMDGGGGGGGRRPRNMGSNPPNGVIVDYWLKDAKPGTKVALAFLGSDGKVIREFKGEVQKEAPKPAEVKAADVSKTAAPAPAAAAAPKEAVKSEGGEAEKQPEAKEENKDEEKLTDVVAGHNRFVWNLRYPDAKKFDGMILWAGGTDGPVVLPGAYQVRLTVGDQAQSAPFEVRQEPRTTASAADLKAQFDFVKGVYDKLSQMNEQITKIRDVRAQLTAVKKRVGDAKEVVAAATALDKKMTAVEEALYQTKNRSSQDPLNYPIRLNDKLAGVGDSAANGWHAPTAQQMAVRDELMAKIDAELAKLKAIWDTDLPAFNKTAASVPAVTVK